MSTVSTHVLNTATGRPGAAIKLVFEAIGPDGIRTEINRAITNADGRVAKVGPADGAIKAGTYRLTFMTGEYFTAAGSRCFYPKVEIEFEIGAADEHFHVPLLISPFGFSTYRGS